MGFVQRLVALCARICLSVMFLASGVNQIIYWKETEKMFMTVVADWQTYTVANPPLQALFKAMAIWSPLLLIIATVLELVGACLLLFGVKERLGAVLLIIVLLPTSFLVQHFWFSETSIKELQLSLFLRDLAIVGGLLVVAARGLKDKGAKNMDFPKDPDFG